MKGLELIEAKKTAREYDLSVTVDGERIGQLLLKLNGRGKAFSIDNLAVELDKRSPRLMGHVLLEGLKKTRQEYGVASLEMYKAYPNPRGEKDDPWLNVSRAVIGLRVERRDVERKFYVSMEPTARQNHERLYTAKRLEREGYTFMSWAQCDDDVRRQLEGLRDETAATHMDWLPTDFPKCDADLTLVALYRGEVCGWMVLERLSEDEADCKRWYAVEKFRRQSAGVKMSGHFFRHIKEKCKRLRFDVRVKDESVMKFYRTFFKDAIENVEYAYRYYWSLNERR